MAPRGGTAGRTDGPWPWASLTSNVMETNERDEVICGPCRGSRVSLHEQPAGCQFGTSHCSVFCAVGHWGGDSAPSSLSLCSQGIGNVRHSPAPAWRHGVPHVTTLFTVSSLDVWCVVLGEYLIQHV